MKKFYVGVVLFLLQATVWGQIAADGLNNSATLFTVSGGTFYTSNSASGDGPGSSPFASEGTHSYGVSNGTAILTTSAINTSSYTGISASFRLASFSIGGTGNGADAGDIVTVEVSPNGGTNYYSTIRVLGAAGAGNAYWAYSATGSASTAYDGNATPVDFQPAGGGSRTADGYSTVTITGLPAVSNLIVRITLLNNATAERWVVDDFKVTGTISCPAPSAPVATAGTVVESNGFTTNWNTVAAAVSYQLDVYTQVANTIAAEWTFPSSGTTVTPDVGTVSVNNTTKTLTTNASAIANSTGATTQAPSTTSWNGGSGNKYWQVIINSTGFYNLKVSSKQYSSGAGPRDFKLQYSTDGSIFNDVINIPAIVSGLWTGGIITNVSLPTACDNQANLYVRWLMYSDQKADNSGTPVNGASNSRIDDISIKGDGRTYVSGYQNFSSTNLSEEITGLSSNTAYNYVVRAVNSCGSASVNSNEITVITGVACTPTATITSFAPATGSTGTLVTITGTGFTGATAVKFGTVAATSFSVVSSTKIIAETPSNTPTDKISVTVSACDAVSATNFTPITQSATCGSVSGTATNLFISEVYDGLNGSLSYVEIFNGTASAINLATGNYDLRINTGVITDIPLTGTINSGAVFIVRLGDSDPNNGSGCGVTIGQSTSAGGFNGNDRIYLGTLVGTTFTSLDYVPNPNYPGSAKPGFSQARKATSIGPSTTYTATDWTISTTENCSNLGIAPYSLTSSSIVINTQPQDENDCSAISFAVVATATPAPVGTYLWKYYNTTTGTWDNASNITNATIGIAANNTNTATMTITGNTAQIYDYQFYCEVTKNTCTVATNAVQYTYNTRLYYRNTGSGNWSNPAIWQMSSDSTNWTGVTSVCMYPTKENSSGVFIQSPYTVTQDLDINIDYLFIKPGGTLTTSLNSQLIVSDSTTGADFVVGGTWNYDANAANSWGPDVTTGTWKLGSSGTIIKTNDGSSQNLRDYYDAGMYTIPSTANWIVRYINAGNVTFTTTASTYYPNLTFESNFGAWAPAVAQSRFTGSTSYPTVKGNLNVGGSGTGTVTITNENTNAQPMLVYGNLTVAAGNTLTTAGTADGTGFEIKGDIAVAGTLTVISNNVGLLKLSDTTGTQTISGAGAINLQDVTASNVTSTIMLNKDITIPGVLTSADGSNLNLNTGNITMKSTAAATARVAPISTGVIGYGTGQFIIERNVAALRSWRLLSIPVVTNQTMRAAWMEGAVPSTTAPLFNQDPVTGYGMHISGPSPATNGFDQTPLNNYSVKYYNGSAWVGTGIQPDTSHLRYKSGWMTFVRGPRSTYIISTTTSGTTPQTTTLRTKGQIYTGTQPNITPAGFTVVGNPYPSAINFSNVTKTLAGAPDGGDIYYIWDPRRSSGTPPTNVGGWVTMTRVGATNNYTPTPPLITTAIDVATGRIESGAAFVVSSANITQLNFKEADKATQSALVFRPANNVQFSGKTGTLRTNLYTKNSDSSLALIDGVMHIFNSAYNNKVDGGDALKLMGFAESVCINSGDTLLSVEKRNLLTEKDTLRLRLKQLQFLNYTFEFVADKALGNNLKGYVEDNFMQSITPLNATGSTKLDFSITSDPGSYAANRFRIVFKKQFKFNQIKAHEHKVDIDVSWKMDATGSIKAFEVEHAAGEGDFKTVGYITVNEGGKEQYLWKDEAPFNGLNYYRVKAITEKEEIVYSDVAEAEFVKGNVTFVYPNPVRGNNIRLQMGSMPKGKYSAVLTGVNGVRITAVEFNNNGAASHNIKIPQSLAPGIYQLQLSGPGGSKSVLKVVVE